jgi:hypothetical protein
LTVVLEFSHEYPLVREHVAAILLPSSSLEEFGNEDVFVRLKDGRELGFTAFALVNVQQLMAQTESNTFISPGMLVVTHISSETIISAIEECLRLSIRGAVPLEHFGILQHKD